METTIYPNTNHTPRVGPYTPSIQNSFAYHSVIHRWPQILTQIIDHLVFQNHSILDLINQINSEKEGENQKNSLKIKLTHGKSIISNISQLKYEAARDKELELLDSHPDYSDQENLTITLYNNEILKSKAAGKPTWFSASWLLTECYLYQKVHGFFNQYEEWKGFDPFEYQKRKTFQSSWEAVSSLCLSLDQSITSIRTHQQQQQQQQNFNLDDYFTLLHVQFNLLLNACLWGNATDLSLLPNMSESEIKELQKKTSNKNEFILRDDTNLVWETCFENKKLFMDCFINNNDHKEKKEQKQEERNQIFGKRIDFVLDNSGFELFTDFVLADWIVCNSNQNIQIVFHPKLIPWFVSDVMKKDIDQLIESMIDPIQFFNLPTTSPSQDDDDDRNHNHLNSSHLLDLVQKIGLRWKSYFHCGVWKILDPDFLSFWTNPLPFWDIPSRDVKLFEQLKQSDLVIFKGDLNYRKLTGDAQWETDTTFEEAIGPLNGEFNLLSLRTCKADVCVGLKSGQESIVSKIDPDWRTNGKFGLITFAPKK